MTKEEKIKFFNAVKGKRIRWSTWKINEYFIPETLSDVREAGYIQGVFSDQINPSFVLTLGIYGGFKKGDELGYWILPQTSHLPDFL